MEAPLSRVEAILQNILGADNVLVPPQSRVEAILLAILNNTEYIHPGDPSRVEEILLAIKDGGSYDKKALSRVEDILIHKLNDEEYTDYSEDDLSRVEKLLIQWIDLHPEVIKELTTSSFPISILANGLPLLDYRIDGNTKQDGFPTPENPIEPEFCGDLVSIELDEPLRAVGDYKDTLDLGTKTYTKRIREYMITGEEDWCIQGSVNSPIFYMDVSSAYYASSGTLTNDAIVKGNPNNYYASRVYVDYGNRTSEYTIETLKKYLREQYTYGTPVKIYYAYRNPPEPTVVSDIPNGMIGNIEGYAVRNEEPTEGYQVDYSFNGKLLPSGKYQIYKTYKIPISSGGVNLFNLETVVEGFLKPNGTIDFPGQGWFTSDYIEINPSTVYTINPNSSYGSLAYHAFYDVNKSFISSVPSGFITVTSPNNAKYLRITFRPNSYDIMVNEGSTPLPYEPYVTPTVKNIYLGQVQTTRRIKKEVLTGEEDIGTNGVIGCCSLPLNEFINISGLVVISTHYSGVSSMPVREIRFGTIFRNRGCNIGIISNPTNVPTQAQIADFKSYLAQQYAAGTPVTVWYVLAEPEVGIFNEPLCRIGDYADSITFEQAGIEIPTLKKPNTTVIDVETSLEPSSMYLKYSEPSDGHAQKTPVLGTKDREIYVTPNNEVYALRR